MSKQITITVNENGNFDWSTTGGLTIAQTFMILEAVKMTILNGEFSHVEEES